MARVVHYPGATRQILLRDNEAFKRPAPDNTLKGVIDLSLALDTLKYLRLISPPLAILKSVTKEVRSFVSALPWM